MRTFNSLLVSVLIALLILSPLVAATTTISESNIVLSSGGVLVDAYGNPFKPANVTDFNVTVAQLISSAAVAWGQITDANATVNQLIVLYGTYSWQGAWNATVQDILLNAAVAWSQITGANATVNQLIAASTFSWGQITNANATVQDLIALYGNFTQDFSWQGAWNATVAGLITNSAIAWGQITNANATVQQLVALYQNFGWQGAWNSTVSDIILNAAVSWSQVTNANTTVNQLIAASTFSWGQITNANATVQQLVGIYQDFGWQGSWNSTVVQLIGNAAIAWSQITGANATVQQLVQAYQDFNWQGTWNSTVTDIILNAAIGWSQITNANATVNQLISAASIAWSQITNANATVQQLVETYQDFSWQSAWNTTVTQLASYLTFLNATTWVNSTNLSTNHLYLGSLTADPSPLTIGMLWYRSDLTTMRYYDGAVVDIPGIGGSGANYTLPYSYTIYKTGSTYYAESGTGVVYSNADADVVYEYAKDALPLTCYIYGTVHNQRTGTIVFRNGNYSFSDEHTISKRMCLKGEAGGTVWFIATAAMSPAFWTVNSTDIYWTDWSVENIGIDMAGYAGDGLYSTQMGHTGGRMMAKVENVKIYNVIATYCGVNFTNPFFAEIRGLTVSSAGTCVKFLGTNVLHTGNSVFEDWLLRLDGNNAVGLNITDGATWRTVNLVQFDRIQIMSANTITGTYGIWWLGNGVDNYCQINSLDIEQAVVGVYLDGVQYVTFVNPFIFNSIDSADSRGFVLVNACQAIDVVGGLVDTHDNAASKAWDDQSTSTGIKHVIMGTRFLTYYGDFETNTKLVNVVCPQNGGSGGARGNRVTGSVTNSSSTSVQTFTNPVFAIPNVLNCWFNTTAITTYTWSSTIDTVSVTVAGTLPASWIMYYDVEYDPTYNDPS